MSLVCHETRSLFSVAAAVRKTHFQLQLPEIMKLLDAGFDDTADVKRRRAGSLQKPGPAFRIALLDPPLLQEKVIQPLCDQIGHLLGAHTLTECLGNGR